MLGFNISGFGYILVNLAADLQIPKHAGKMKEHNLHNNNETETTMSKKLMAVVAAFALSAPVLAAPGVYVQGDIGAAKVKAKNGASVSKSGFSPRVTVGYDFGNNIRAGVDYTHYKNLEYGRTAGNTSLSGEAKFQSVGVSAIYDIPTASPVKPYVGARLGINRVSDDFTQTTSGATNSVYTSSVRKTRTGVGALAGVGYEVADNLTLDAGYRYNHWGKFDNVKVNSHEASVGVRYKF